MTTTNGTDATIAELRARLAAVERAQAPRSRRGRRVASRRRSRFVAALALVALALLIPLGALAAGSFTDLNPGSGHNPNIQAIADVGITTGCNPPDFTQYCPNDLVTREQMASFLARAAGLGANPPVANAKTAQTAANATNATNAQNAAALQGRPANALSRAAAAQTKSALSGATGGSLNVVNVTITAPGPGYVIVNGATEFVSNACDTANDECRFQAYLTHAGANDTSPSFSVFLGGNGKNERDIASMSWVFPVQAGPQLFTIQVKQLYGPAQAALLLDNQITALYVPFGPDGNTP